MIARDYLFFRTVVSKTLSKSQMNAGPWKILPLWTRFCRSRMGQNVVGTPGLAWITAQHTLQRMHATF